MATGIKKMSQIASLEDCGQCAELQTHLLFACSLECHSCETGLAATWYKEKKTGLGVQADSGPNLRA